MLLLIIVRLRVSHNSSGSGPEDACDTGNACLYRVRSCQTAGDQMLEALAAPLPCAAQERLLPAQVQPLLAFLESAGLLLPLPGALCFL